MKPSQKYLVTRGTSWQDLAAWKVLRLTDEPNLLTCRKHSQLSACLTAHEAARVVFRLLPGAEVYMWDEPDWLPTPSTAGHQAFRIVGTVGPNGVWGTQRDAVSQ